MGFYNNTKDYGSLEGGTGIFPERLPRLKFNFVLEITLSESSKAEQFDRVKSATLPDITFDTQIVNQYNIKRVIQTKMNYGPCTVVFYDTYDNDFYNKIMLPYTKNYYNKNEGIFATTSISAKTNSVIPDTFSQDFGYKAVSDATNRYYIPQIIIAKVGSDGKRFSHIMSNCMITSISGDTLDYSDSQPIQYTVTFQPERVELVDRFSIIP